MRKIISAILALLLLTGCGTQTTTRTTTVRTERESRAETRAAIDEPVRKTTSRGTPIAESSELPSVTMIETPNSTCFSEIGWDKGTGTLFVVFRDSGARYAYDEVPRAVWNELKSADSMGTYYNKHIKGQYDCCKIED